MKQRVAHWYLLSVFIAGLCGLEYGMWFGAGWRAALAVHLIIGFIGSVIWAAGTVLEGSNAD